jgi:hypothetical protein
MQRSLEIILFVERVNVGIVWIARANIPPTEHFRLHFPARPIVVLESRTCFVLADAVTTFRIPAIERAADTLAQIARLTAVDSTHRLIGDQEAIETPRLQVAGLNFEIRGLIEGHVFIPLVLPSIVLRNSTSSRFTTTDLSASTPSRTRSPRISITVITIVLPSIQIRCPLFLESTNMIYLDHFASPDAS